MEPINLLTHTEQEALASYLTRYAGVTVTEEDVPNILREWNKQKRKLVKALGGKLRAEVDIKIPEEEKRRALSAKIHLVTGYHSIPFYKYREALTREDPIGYININYSSVCKDSFFFDVVRFILSQRYFEENPIEFTSFTRLFDNNNLAYNALPYKVEFTMRGKTFKFGVGAKPVKAVRSILKHIQYPRMDQFEEWRNKISDAHTKASAKGKLVLSVNPLDYFTASDNSYNWSTCISWTGKGCHSHNILEFLNSNNVVIAYLEGNKPYQVNGFDFSNKRWRVFLTVTKPLLCIGKSYPYESEELADLTLKFAANLVEKNFNWTYKYKDQLYLDCCNGLFVSNDDIKRTWYFGENKHKILLYTHKMYNDIVEDKSSNYPCYRNYTDKTKKISISGKQTCLMCGDYVFEEGEVVCENCIEEHGCHYCESVDRDVEKYNLDGIQVCENCIDNYVYSIHEQVFIPKNDLRLKKIYVYPELSDSQMKILYDALYKEKNRTAILEILNQSKIPYKSIPCILYSGTKGMLGTGFYMPSSKEEWYELDSVIKTVPARHMFNQRGDR